MKFPNTVDYVILAAYLNYALLGGASFFISKIILVVAGDWPLPMVGGVPATDGFIAAAGGQWWPSLTTKVVTNGTSAPALLAIYEVV